MFSGCGGMDSGFKKAGFEIIWANDNDRAAVETYKYNIGSIVFGNIADIDLKSIPEHEILLSGFPCQAYSNAGNRKGVKDLRGKLYEYSLQAIKIHKPKVIIFENVRGILSIMGESGKGLVDEICERLQSNEFGYNTNWKLLNACNYEVPQNRIRLFIVGVRKDLDTEFIFPEEIPITNNLLLENILTIGPEVPNHTYKKFADEINQMIPYIKEGGSWKDIPDKKLTDRLMRIRKELKKYRSPNFYRRFSRKEINGTITATATPENCGIIHPTENRRYTVRECARIQSFDDSYKFIIKSESAGYRIIGNAVPPRLAYHIAKQIKLLIQDKTNYTERFGIIDYKSRQRKISNRQPLKISGQKNNLNLF